MSRRGMKNARVRNEISPKGNEKCAGQGMKRRMRKLGQGMKKGMKKARARNEKGMKKARARNEKGNENS
jgi:hypothetical protein